MVREYDGHCAIFDVAAISDVKHFYLLSVYKRPPKGQYLERHSFKLSYHNH
jgi:hypothetical protein